MGSVYFGLIRLRAGLRMIGVSGRGAGREQDSLKRKVKIRLILLWAGL